jgi:hypothetical protein
LSPWYVPLPHSARICRILLVVYLCAHIIPLSPWYVPLHARIRRILIVVFMRPYIFAPSIANKQSHPSSTVWCVQRQETSLPTLVPLYAHIDTFIIRHFIPWYAPLPYSAHIRRILLLPLYINASVFDICPLTRIYPSHPTILYWCVRFWCVPLPAHICHHSPFDDRRITV